MANKKLIIAGAVGAALCAAAAGGAAWAHHAFAAEFDGKAPVLLRGKVTRVEWINPHAWVHIKDNTSGQDWMVEGGTPNTLLRSGIDRNSLKPGTEIIVRGYQSKDKLCRPACKANGRDVTFPDGKKLFMGSSGTGAPTDGSDPTDKK
jgi:opacity protein-like surface antigen